MCAGIPFEIAIGTKIGSTTDMVAILEPMQAWTWWLLSANKKLEFPDRYKFFPNWGKSHWCSRLDPKLYPWRKLPSRIISIMIKIANTWILFKFHASSPNLITVAKIVLSLRPFSLWHYYDTLPWAGIFRYSAAERSYSLFLSIISINFEWPGEGIGPGAQHCSFSPRPVPSGSGNKGNSQYRMHFTSHNLKDG